MIVHNSVLLLAWLGAADVAFYDGNPRQADLDPRRSQVVASQLRQQASSAAMNCRCWCDP